MIFNKKFKYDGRMDPESIPLCDAMNALPGITTKECCCGHSSDNFSIFFRVQETDAGLFFLTRCIDKRYWKYGYLWGIELSVGDVYRDKHLPVTYHLHSGPIVGEDAYQQAQSLLDNMNHHLNHENFMNGFDLDINDFDII